LFVPPFVTLRCPLTLNDESIAPITICVALPLVASPYATKWPSGEKVTPLATLPAASGVALPPLRPTSSTCPPDV
jgi:hypothetical protein